jgi:hypothetical protein
VVKNAKLKARRKPFWPVIVTFLKRTVATNFLSRVISPNVPTRALVHDLHQFQILIQIRQDIQLFWSFRTIGHNGRFGYALWGHCGGFGYTLGATVRNEAVP